MFYCDNCAKEKKWQPTFFKSVGKCEICDKKSVCSDRPLSQLPIRNPNVNFGDPYCGGFATKFDDTL